MNAGFFNNTSLFVKRTTSGAATFLVAASDASANVRARADYRCDGTADDVEIQKAIDALPVQSDGNIRGVIELSAGVFNITNTVHMFRELGDNGNTIFLKGQGTNVTSLYLVSGSDCDIVDAVVPNGSDTDFMFFGLKDLTLNGARFANASGNGFYVKDNSGAGSGSVYDMYIDHVMAYHCKDRGFYIYDSWGAKITNSITEYCDSDGFYLRGSQNYVSNHFSAYNQGYAIYARCTDSLFSNIHLLNNAKTSLYCAGASFIMFNNVHISGYGNDYNGHTTAWSKGIEVVYGVQGCKFTNVHLEGENTTNSYLGIECNGARCMFSNIYSQGSSHYPIKFDIEAADNTVNNCVLEEGSNSSEQVTDIASGIKTVETAPTAGGSGYSVNDILTLDEGTNGKVTVLTVDGSGAVQTLRMSTKTEAGGYISSGYGYTVAAGKATSGGTGTGCTVEVTALETNNIGADIVYFNVR